MFSINYNDLEKPLRTEKLSSDIFLSDIIVKCTRRSIPQTVFPMWRNFTHCSLRRIPAASAAAVWPLYMTPTQETDATVETLNAGMTQPVLLIELVNASIAQVKPGGTVTACIAYNANYADKPVTLTAVASFMGEELGTKTIELQ